jgi:hypothetical protein
MATDQSEAAICVVCGDPAEPPLSAECNWCDARFHLNQRNDGGARDCGEVWIDEQFLALQFACHTCLANDGASPPETSSPLAPLSRGPERRRYRKRA